MRTIETAMQDRARRLNRVPDAPVSLRDRAYQEIKRRINKMEFRPGAYLNEAQISRTLRIGRTPVHQALDRLMLEGLVQVIPRKGVMVETISLDQVLQIIDVRLVNEPFCVGLAAECATPSEVAQLRALLDASGPLIRARDREQLMDLDRQFHWKISLAAKNAVLAETITRLHDRSLRFWFISLGDDLQLRRVDEEHRSIMDAVARRDTVGAADAMRHHIESSRKHIARAI
jgi:GntR family transcriptional regulator, rspAB operon transcriptional repressor